jgi:putative transposase
MSLKTISVSGRPQTFLSSFGPIRQHFAIKRNQLGAVRYRTQLASRFAIWHLVTGVTQNPSTAF